MNEKLPEWIKNTKGALNLVEEYIRNMKQLEIKVWNEALQKVREIIDLVTDKEDNQADSTYLKREVESLKK